MKKTFRSVLSLILALIMITASVSAVFAGTVTYKGQNGGFEYGPGSTYTTTDLFENLKGAMPGDELEETITFENASADSDYVMLYLKAVVLEEGDITEDVLTLSPEEEPNRDLDTMKDFLHQLELIVKDGNKTLYQGSPDVVNDDTGLNDYVLLGKFYEGEKTDLKATLKVPAELGNEYASKVGTVKWVFHVEAFDEDVLTVRKVWSDELDAHVNDKIQVNLIKETTNVKTGEKSTSVEDSVSIGAEDNWAYTWTGLQTSKGFITETERYSYSVEEEPVKGYTTDYITDGNVITIINLKNHSVKPPVVPPNPPVNPTSVSITKVWELAEGEEMPSGISATLYENGKAAETVVLNSGNGWSYSWSNLSAASSWSVGESDVPDGFTSYYSGTSTDVTVTNVSDKLNKPPLAAVTTRTVVKEWDDDNNALGLRPASVTVTLYKDGEAAGKAVLSEANGWTYTWSELDATCSWSIAEDPSEGYEALYVETENGLTITNVLSEVPLSGSPVDITVHKVWSMDNQAKRPANVSVMLYNGTTPVEAVTLNAENNWSYSWKELDGMGSWQVLETSIPKGYTPSYVMKDGVLTITNTASLIQTGQKNLPILVLGAAGLLLMVIGFMLTRKKKAEEQ